MSNKVFDRAKEAFLSAPRLSIRVNKSREDRKCYEIVQGSKVLRSYANPSEAEEEMSDMQTGLYVLAVMRALRDPSQEMLAEGARITPNALRCWRVMASAMMSGD